MHLQIHVMFIHYLSRNLHYMGGDVDSNLSSHLSSNMMGLTTYALEVMHKREMKCRRITGRKLMDLRRCRLLLVKIPLTSPEKKKSVYEVQIRQ